MRFLCLILFPMVLSAGEAEEATKVAALVDRFANFAGQGEDIHTLDPLFSKTFRMFEQGGVDPSWASYRDHHLGPELKAFEKFSITNENKQVRVEGAVAWVTQSMHYHIVLKKDGREINSRGTVTYLLEKLDGEWRFVHIHWSHRPLKK